jgi:hypothetical protein
VTALIVLKVTESEDEVRDILPKLEVALSAHATDAVPQDTGNKASASGKHDLTSRTILAADASGVMALEGHTYVLWKTTLHLPRPRARLQRPAVYFTTHVTISNKALSAPSELGSDMLKSFEPLPANVLEPLLFDPALRDSDIYLSETRITKVAPAAAQLHDDVKPIRGASKRAFPIVPALFTRIRYSALPDAVVASLHLETTQLVNGSVKINNVYLDVPNAKVESIYSLELPQESRGGDETVLLYKLSQASESAGPSPAAVFVKIDASVATEQGSQTNLEIKWQAQVDLSQAASKPTYKWSRPLSGSKLPVRPSSEGAARPPSMDVNSTPSTGDSGITFTFTAAPKVVQNENFKLDVQCLNRSARPRRFALVVLQPKRTNTKQPQPQAQENSADTGLIASLFDAPPLERPRAPDVLDLNPDVRIGPLPPGACFETRMKFRALKTGALDLGVIRIVDLDTRQTVDVRELPDVISLDQAPDGEEGDSEKSEDSTAIVTIAAD